MTCFACERIEQIKAGTNPYFIEELEESYLVLADNQFYEGYCIHLLKEHHEQHQNLPQKVQLTLFAEIARTAKAISECFSPVRLNYACLCNECHHIHWHVIPRYASDPTPKDAIWTPENLARKALPTKERCHALVERIRNALKSSDRHAASP